MQVPALLVIFFLLKMEGMLKNAAPKLQMHPGT